MRTLSNVALALALAALVGACASSHPDTYTNVTAPTAGGKTLTGSVVSFTDSSVTLKTITGQEVIALTSATRGRESLVVGANVAVDFERSSGRGEPVATRIEPAPGHPPEPQR